MTYRIRNWNDYQHYKSRAPIWVKLYFSTLSSQDWVASDDATRVLAIACILIASRHNGEIPNDPLYVQRIAYLNKKPDFAPLVRTGFLVPVGEDASNALADCYQVDSGNANITSIKIKEEKNRACTQMLATCKHEYSTEFLAWWALYPKKVNKLTAFAEWKLALKRATATTLIEALQAQLQGGNFSNDPQYILYPERWLKRGKWEDEIGVNKTVPTNNGIFKVVLPDEEAGQ